MKYMFIIQFIFSKIQENIKNNNKYFFTAKNEITLYTRKYAELTSNMELIMKNESFRNSILQNIIEKDLMNQFNDSNFQINKTIKILLNSKSGMDRNQYNEEVRNEKIMHLNNFAFRRNRLFLIFHYLKRRNMECQLCKFIEEKIPLLKIKTYKLNQFEDLLLGLRFFRLHFPSFTVYEDGYFYDLKVRSFSELKTVIDKRSWNEHQMIFPNGLSKIIMSYFMYPFLLFYTFLSDHIIRIPTWLWSLFFGFCIIYLIFNMFEIFKKF